MVQTMFQMHPESYIVDLQIRELNVYMKFLLSISSAKACSKCCAITLPVHDAGTEL